MAHATDQLCYFDQGAASTILGMPALPGKFYSYPPSQVCTYTSTANDTSGTSKAYFQLAPFAADDTCSDLFAHHENGGPYGDEPTSPAGAGGCIGVREVPPLDPTLDTELDGFAENGVQAAVTMTWYYHPGVASVSTATALSALRAIVPELPAS